MLNINVIKLILKRIMIFITRKYDIQLNKILKHTICVYNGNDSMMKID